MNDFTDSPQVLKCRTTADFLAALPWLVGFTATDSIFVVLFSGKRAGRAFRVDLPDEEHPNHSITLLDLICNTVKDLGAGAADAPAIAISCERTFAEEGAAPWRRFAKRLERRLRREGLSPRELCCIAPDGWVSYLEPEPPLLGHPLSEIAESPIAGEAQEHQRGRGLAGLIPDLSRLGEIPEAEPLRAAAVTEALAELPAYQLPSPTPEDVAAERLRSSARLPNLGGHRGGETTAWPEEHYAWLTETVTVGRALRGGGERLSPRMTARLLRTAEHPDRWLVLAMGILTRPEFPLEISLESAPHHFAASPIDIDAGPGRGPRIGWSIRRVLASISPDFTEHERLAPLRRLLVVAISESPRALRPGALALSAWVWWLSGNQTVAARQVLASLDIDPDHELSLMVHRLIAVPVCANQLASWPRRAAA